MEEPRFVAEGWLDPDKRWELKADAPDWAKKEFEEFDRASYSEYTDATGNVIVSQA